MFVKRKMTIVSNICDISELTFNDFSLIFCTSSGTYGFTDALLGSGEFLIKFRFSHSKVVLDRKREGPPVREVERLAQANDS